MKVGIRKRSYKKSFSASTTGRLTRMKNGLGNPFYGKKGVGLLKNPSKYMKGVIYRRTTIGVTSRDIGRALNKSQKEKEKRQAEKRKALEEKTNKIVCNTAGKIARNRARREFTTILKNERDRLIKEEDQLRKLLGAKYHL